MGVVTKILRVNVRFILCYPLSKFLDLPLVPAGVHYVDWHATLQREHMHGALCYTASHIMDPPTKFHMIVHTVSTQYTA